MIYRPGVKKNWIFSEFFCTSNSHCGLNGVCIKETGECECKDGTRFDGSQCVGMDFAVSWSISNNGLQKIQNEYSLNKLAESNRISHSTDFTIAWFLFLFACMGLAEQCKDLLKIVHWLLQPCRDLHRLWWYFKRLEIVFWSNIN